MCLVSTSKCDDALLNASFDLQRVSSCDSTRLGALTVVEPSTESTSTYLASKIGVFSGQFSGRTDHTYPELDPFFHLQLYTKYTLYMILSPFS